MKDDSNHMDKAIKEKFEGHEVRVPSNLWNSIESKLPPPKGGFHLLSLLKKPLIISTLLVSTVATALYVYTPAQETFFSNQTDSVTSASQTNTSVYSNSNTSSAMHDKSENRNMASNLKINKENSLSIEEIQSTKNTANAGQTNVYNQKKSESVKDESNQYASNSLNRNQNQSNKINKEDHSKKIRSSTNPENTVTNKSIRKKPNHLSSSIQSNQISAARNIKAASKVKTANTAINSDANTTDENVKSQQRKTITPIAADSIFIDPFYLSQESMFMQTDKKNSGNSFKNTSAAHIKDSTLYTEPSASNNLKTTLSSSEQINAASSNQNKKSDLLSESTSIKNEQNAVSDSSANVNQSAISAENTIDRLLKTTVENKTITHNNSDTFSYGMQTADTSLLASSEKANTNPSTLDTLKENKNSDSASTIKKIPETISTTLTEEQKKKSVFLSKCSVDGYVTPALAYMHTSPNSTDEKINTYASTRNQGLKPGSGIAAGLRMNYSLTQKIEIGIGFQYSGMSQKSTLTHSTLDSTYLTYKGFTQVDSTYDTTRRAYTYTSHYILTDSSTHNVYSSHTQTYINKYQSFSIPIHIAYGYSITDRISLLARTSLLINYTTYSVTFLNETEENVLAYHSRKNISLGGSFSIGVYYAFAKRYSVFTEPILNYYFSNVFDSQVPFKQTQFLLGLQTGVRLSF